MYTTLYANLGFYRLEKVIYSIEKGARYLTERRKARRNKFLKNSGITLFFLAASCLISYLLHDFRADASGNSNVAMVFILAIFLIARFTDGYWYGIVSSLIGVLGVNYVFTYPYMEFNFTLTGYPISIICMLLVSLITSSMMTEVKKSQKRQMEAEREKMRGDLLRAISHDLRTPLTAILGTVTLLEENEKEILPQERVALLQGAKKDIQWLINLVVNLLTVTRIEGGENAHVVKQPEFVEEMVSESVQKFRKRFPEQSVKVSVPEEAFLVPMDAILMEQVVINLLENAVLHGEKGEELQLHIDVWEKKGAALLRVRDNGVGIAPDVLKRINSGRSVTPTAGDGHKNMGIGLSVCRSIVMAHDGELEAENLAEGAAFTIRLPLDETLP